MGYDTEEIRETQATGMYKIQREDCGNLSCIWAKRRYVWNIVWKSAEEMQMMETQLG